VSVNCNKRKPGSGCSSLEGYNRSHSIFGYSDKCAAVNPSDLSVALAALEAVVNVQGPDGKTRSIPFADFHRLPGDTPERDNDLRHGELITTIDVPRSNFAPHSYYLKVGDRASHSFALVSVAAALELKGNVIKTIRIAMGGVAPKPWRAVEAERSLTGKEATEANYVAAAEAAMKGAMPLEHNEFKVELGKRAIVLALKRASAGKS
jgi:xanthine dehydrogenase YagS FAD-binding subunit